MAHVFISYRKKDRELCIAVQARLEAAGHTVWWDDRLRPGKEWAPVIEEQLRLADAVVVLWTRNATRSKWVYFEAMMAAGMQKLVMLAIGNTGEAAGRLATKTFYPFDPSWPAGGEQWTNIMRRIEEAAADGRSLAEPVASLDDVTWSLIKRSRDVEDFADYLSRYPDGPHSAEAHARHDQCRVQGRRRAALWWSVGLLFYGALLVPPVALLLDYRGAEALFWSNLYFPFFAFQVLFGAMMVPIYCFTLAKALRFALQRDGRTWRTRAIGLAVLIGVPALTAAVIASIEVSDGYAPWQFRQVLLDTPLSELARRAGAPLVAVPGEADVRGDTRTLRATFEATRDLSLSSLWDQRNRPLGAERCLAAPSGGAPGGEPHGSCLTHMNNLQRLMEAVRSDQSNWSNTAFAYKYFFFFPTLLFIGSYFNILYIGEQAGPLRAWMARLSPWSGQRFSQLLMCIYPRGGVERPGPGGGCRSATRACAAC